MPEHFVDTWFFVARLSRFDEHYAGAQRLETRFGNDLVTHDGVLTELLAFFLGFGQGGRAAAERFVGRMIRESTIVKLDRRLFLEALDLYEQRRDKEYSLVDCASIDRKSKRLNSSH